MTSEPREGGGAKDTAKGVPRLSVNRIDPRERGAINFNPEGVHTPLMRLSARFARTTRDIIVVPFLPSL